jgi:hypothetical protein
VRILLSIGDIKVPLIENLSDAELRELIRRIIDFAKSNPQNAERDVLDFKTKLNISDKHKMRKLFSSFANTRGGLLIVGIDEKKGCNVVGVQDVPKDEQLSQILSTNLYIRPPVRYSPPCAITYQSKKLILFYIYESRNLPIEMRRGKNEPWVAYCRRNSVTSILSESEIILKFYRGIMKLPLHLQVDTSQLGYYSSDDIIRKPFTKWTVKKQGEVYKWLQLMWMPLLPLPLPFIPFRYISDLYGSYASWFGSREKLRDILTELESKIQETYGIGYEVWTVPLRGTRTFIEDHTYVTGCGAKYLKNCLMKLCKNKRVTNFGWFLSAKSVSYTIIGSIHGDQCDININSIIGFIPNNFPFVSIDDVGRVILEPLPANKITVMNNMKDWRLPVDGEFWLEDLSDEQLAKFPSAKITGYLGGKPRPRNYDLPFRANGLTILEMNMNTRLPENAPPLVTNITPFPCHVSSAPSGLNDLKEVKVIGIDCNVLPLSQYPAHDLTLILFSVKCYVNQSKSYRLPKAEYKPR